MPPGAGQRARRPTTSTGCRTMTEAEIRIARTFRPRDWVWLTPAFLRIMSFVDGRVDHALACINLDLREGRLHAALVAPDNTLKMRLEASDWQRRAVHAPHIPAEGVRVEPYEEGRFIIWRADLDREYPTNPATPASAADRQLYAAGEPEPAPAIGPEPVSPSPQGESESPPVKLRRGPSEQYDWDEGFRCMRMALDRRGDPLAPENADKGWCSDADVARLVAASVATGGQQPDPKHTERRVRRELKKWRAEQAERNGA